MTNVEIFAEQQDNTGEGPLWSMGEQALYWIDIGRKALYRKEPAQERAQCWTLPDYPGCVAEISPGAIAVALGDGIQRLNLHTGAVSLISAAPPRCAGTRFNDGKVDPLGRLWVGTMQNNFGPNGESIAVEHALGALYRFDHEGAHTIEENVYCSNTLAWSTDLRRFYFADSIRGEIYVYDFDAPSGQVRNKRIFFEDGARGIPDGSAIDVDGCLWNARWDGGAILRITPDGKLDRIIELPVRRPTSCAFGGPALDTLFVTSARNGLSSEELTRSPLSGSVFAITGAGQGLSVPPMVCKQGS